MHVSLRGLNWQRRFMKLKREKQCIIAAWKDWYLKSFATTLVLVSDEKYISKEIEKSQKLIDSISLKIKKELKIKNKKPSQNN